MSAKREAEILVDLIDALVYGESFDCAVTFEELQRFSLMAVEQDELRHQLADPPLRDFVTERDGLYTLRGREDLIDRRRERQARTLMLRRRGRLVASCLQYLPFVRGVVLTGSVAAGDADKAADIDMLVIVRERRIASTFVVLASLSRLLSRSVFCPNYYLSEVSLEVSRRDHYVARELVQAESLSGSAESLFAANTWVLRLFPNATPRGCVAPPRWFGSMLQRILEWPFRGLIGDRLERRFHPLVLKRLAVHHAGFGDLIPEEARLLFDAGVELRFHGSPVVERAIARYIGLRAELVQRIARTLESGESKAAMISR